MLSIDNPPPADPPIFQRLKIINIKDDEKLSDQNLPNLPEDLSNTAVVPDQSAILPNFSLRDYVFDARNKNIQNNWPFPLKNLQLCLKHGVKDLLPPFQSPDRVRNQQPAECGCVSSTSEFQNTGVFHEDFSGPKEHIELDTSDAKLDEKQVISTCIESSSCRREGENGFFSTMPSILQPQKEWGLSSGPSSSSLKIDNLFKTIAEVETTTGFPGSEKNRIKIKTLGKRCKIIRKSTNHVDQTSATDIATSISTISESMVSKVCPVCKAFSSSSNTTLNAHIDQCLSVASTSKCSSDSKLTRYRIKPRKTKLMVDIYATARTCTLEDLDRRNGTAWATLSSFPAQDIENAQTNTNRRKKQKVVTVHPEDIGNNDGAVYIDGNGTKLRILSKVSSPSSLQKLQDEDSRDLRSEVKARKLYSAKKNKFHAPKRHQYFKVVAQGRKGSAQKCIISQVQEGHNQRKAGSSLEVHKITKQAKPHASGRMLRQWACSKRTGASKSIMKEGYQPSTLNWHMPRGTAVDTDRSVSAAPFLERRSQVQNHSNFSEHCVSSPESSEQTDDTDYEVRISDKRGWSPVKRSLRSSFSGEMVDSGSPTQMKKITSHSSKCSSFFGSSYLVKPQNTNGKIIQDYQSSDFPHGSNKLSRNYRESALKARKLNSPGRKEILVSSRSSTGSKSPKKRDHFGTQTVQGMIAWRSNFDHNDSSSDVRNESDQSAKEETEVMSPKVSSELKNRSNREAMSKTIAALSSFDLEPECDEENMDSHVRMHEIKGIELGRKENSFHEDVSVESFSKLAPKESFMCFCKSIDPQFQKTINNAKTHRGMLQSTHNCSCSFYGLDGEKGGFSESSFGHAQEMLITDEDNSAMIGYGVQRELDSEVRQENSCFEVDPISIPGPPGSFLPSPPRDMRSDEYQGKPSLSNSWVHSCQDQDDLIDGDSSGSPISAASTISNSTAPRSCLKHNSSSRVSSDVFHEKLGSASQNASALPSVENDVGLPACTRDRKINGDMFINTSSVERETLVVANDGQPCRCQRVDRASQGINVTYQEPQPKKNHLCTLETRPAMNVRPNRLDIMSEGPALSNYRHATPEYMGFPVDKSPFKSDPVYRNCEPASPVTSNSVLRLMGKNLMVVNKEEEDVAMPVKQPQPHPQLNHLSTPVTSFAGGSPKNVRNKVSCSFPYWTHQDSSKDQNIGNVLGQSLDVSLSKGLRNLANLKQQTDGGHTASRVYKGDYTNKVANRPERKKNKAAMCNRSRAFKMPDHQQINSLSASNAIKKTNEMGDALQIIAPGVSIPLITYSGNPLHVNPFCCTKPKDASNLDKPTTIHNSSFQSAAPSRKDHTSPVKWDCSSESPYVCRRGVF